MQIRSKEQWQQLFAEQAASGLSAQQFCLDKKLCAKYFSLRRSTIGVREQLFLILEIIALWYLFASKQACPRTGFLKKKISYCH